MITPHIKKHLTDDEILICDRVKEVLESIPDIELPSGGLISCHLVCRVIQQAIPELDVCDGFFHPGIEHSWIDTPNVLIDPYPPGALYPPFIYHKGFLLGWKTLYLEAYLPLVATPEFGKDLDFLADQAWKGKKW